MAYGNGGSRDDLKRMADIGRTPMSADLLELRRKCLAVVASMARAVWPDRISAPKPTGKEIDAVLLRLQSQASRDGVNNVWAEKMRLLAKSSVLEQWSRAQRCLFGRLKHVSSRGETPMKSGRHRLVNLPEEWTDRLDEEDVAALQALADDLDFRAAMALFRRLDIDDADLSAIRAEALRAMAGAVEARFGCPQWREDAVLQLHLDYRCVRGCAEALNKALGVLTAAVSGAKSSKTALAISSHRPRGPAIPIELKMPAPVAIRFDDCPDQIVKSIAIELGPVTAAAKAVVLRKPRAPAIAGQIVVLAEDFGFVNTSSMVIARCAAGISPEALAFALSEPGKRATKAFLEGHVSGDEVEILERLQLSGRNFLDRIVAQALRIDALRAEIDLGHNRLKRLKTEINRLAGRDATESIPKDLQEIAGSKSERDRHAGMHRRFFRLLDVLARLKARRREIYRKVAGLKKSWFGHVANIRTRLAEAYGAVIAREDLSILAVERKDPDYKGENRSAQPIGLSSGEFKGSNALGPAPRAGKTFNKMINNGAKGQYTRIADDKADWRGIARILLPSWYSSSTDWRTGRVDRSQRKGAVFTAADGARWDADLHAGEMLARWLFLREKTAAQAAL
jgi:hypothetical protein